MTSAIQHSAIYEGWVQHRRFAVTRHQFRYPLYMMLLDLDEVDAVLDLHPLWGHSRWAAAGFHCADYFRGATSLHELKRQLLQQFQQAGFAVCRVSILTNLRCFGVVMNPLSCYFGFDANGRCIAMLAEVTNTPWGERHHYWLSTDKSDRTTSTGSIPVQTPWRIHERTRGDHRYHYGFDKAFHVSPFNPMALHYLWTLNTPQPGQDHHLISHLALHDADQLCFDATLSLWRRPVSRQSLGRVLWRYPLQSLQVASGIYWQALRLWWRGARFHPHPRQPVTPAAAVQDSSQPTGNTPVAPAFKPENHHEIHHS